MNGLLNALINYTQPQRDKYAGLLTDAVTGVPDRAKKLAQGLLNAPSQLAQLASPQSYTALQNEMLAPRQAQPGKWIDAGMELSGMAPVGGLLAHTVYHGSPHKFDKFDMSKIGTGEGAQAYGHGLYFAENPGVARSYQEQVTAQRKGNLNYKGNYLSPQNPSDWQIARMQMDNIVKPNDWTLKPSVDLLYKANGNIDEALKYAEGYGIYNKRDLSKLRKTMASINYADIQKPESYLYKVDIPDEAIPRMLDWDAALSKQPESIKPILRNLLNDAYGDGAAFNASGIGETAKDYLMNQSGASAADIIKNLSRRYGDDVASKMLREAGIPGIRYLDGSSRGAGQGTSNFVLFDDQLARIIERNGQPTGLLPWKEGEWLNLNSK